MKKPTVEDVRKYCIERGNKIDPEAFVDHYTATGWKIGKASMVDWQAAIRTWERNQGFRKVDAAKRETVAEQIRKFEKRHGGDLEPIDGKWLKAVKDKSFGVKSEEEFL